MDAYERARVLIEEGRTDEARRCLLELLSERPEHGEAWHALGRLRLQGGETIGAKEAFARAATLMPAHAATWHLLGLAQRGCGEPLEALTSLKRAVSLDPAEPTAFNNLGLVERQLDLLDRAERSFERALRLSPDYAAARRHLAGLLRETGRVDAARPHLERLLARDPDDLGARLELAHGLLVSDPAAAVSHYLALARQHADDAEIVLALGRALALAGRASDAVKVLRRGVELAPNEASAWFTLGNSSASAGDPATAIAAFSRYLELVPQDHRAVHNLAQARFVLGDVDAARQGFEAALGASEDLRPLEALAVLIPGCPSADPDAIASARRRFLDRAFAEVRVQEMPRRLGSDLVRVGYVSSFFQDDNWMKPVCGVLNHHDRSRFEVTLLSDCPQVAVSVAYRPDPRDRYIDLRGLSGDAANARVREADLDVLVDLNGYSKPQRLELFVAKPARRTVTWFNMYATSGLATFDALVGDDEVIRPEEEAAYVEPVRRVPGSYLAFEVGYPVPDVTLPPSLENGCLTFGCLASQYKLTPQVLATFATILRAAPSARLLLRNSALASDAIREFVVDRFSAAGIAKERLTLLGRAPHREFLETYALVDVALDPFPYNGGTTTTEALWQGVPVLCYRGDRWAARTSASLVARSPFVDWVQPDLEAYVATAVRWAQDPDAPRRLAESRRGAREALRRSPVCDVAGLARALEDIYRTLVSEPASDRS